jgi:leucyl-tRNA synthetase
MFKNFSFFPPLYTNSEQGDTIHHQVFPEVPEADVGLSAASTYIRSTSSSITSSESNYAKKLSKGRNVSFDPRKPKKITICAAKNFPAWQEKYIDLVRESFDSLKVTVDDKGLNAKVGKLGEMKKAMPFVQGLKKRLVNSREAPDTVFSRKLPYDEIAILQELATGIKRTTGAKEVEIISVDEGGKSGTVVGTGEKRENLQGEHAVPGQPSFMFANIE